MENLKHFQVQKFNGKNFQLWKYQMEIIFRSEAHMFELVNGETPCPVDGAVRTSWNTLNAKAMLIISSGMEYEQLQTVVSCRTAPEMWSRLKSVHEQRSSVNKLQLKQQFFNYKMTETDTIAQHFSKIDSLAQALNDIEEPVKEVDKIAKVLGSLPMKYGSFITSWDSYDETKQTYDNLVARLLKEETRLTETEEMAVAFASLNTGKMSKTGADQKERTIDKRNIECFYCKKKGHYKAECRKRQYNIQRQTGIKQPWHKEDKNQKHQALLVEYKNIVADDSEEEWLGDSAASKHMSHRRDWFTTFHEGNVKDLVQIGDNSQIEVEGYGNIQLLALVNGEWEPRTIENVLYVPKLRKNLFSVGAATSRNLKVIFCKDRMEIYSNRLVATGLKQSNQCYKMLFKRETVSTTANISTTDSAMLWHERLGHINFQSLKNMADQGLLSGTQIRTTEGLFCEACQYGKVHRLPFKRKSLEKGFKPGEYIHMDLCGKMSHSSVSGANYYILFKDDCTSYRIVRFIKHKSDAFSKFVEIQKLIERQTGNVIKIVRSDRGLEFNNDQFRQLFREKGIISEFSAPYTAEQNGKIERENRTIVETARSMLFAAKAKPNLWAEAVNTSVYLLNRRPRESDKQIPYEQWTRRQATLKHLRKFGSEVYTHVPKQFRSKFDRKSKKMILVGYDNDSPNYRVMDPETSKIVITRDVVFNEKGDSKNQEEEHTMFTLINLQEGENTQDKVETTEEDEIQIISGESENLRESQQEETELDTRKSHELRDRRKIQKPEWYTPSLYMACAAIIMEEPRSYEEATSSTEASKWRQAMEEEMNSLAANKTWSLVPLPKSRKAIDCKWVYKLKRKSDGQIERYKARLCARGFLQARGIDYNDTFSPVIRYDSIRVLLALAAIHKLDIQQFDVKTAFLHGELTDEIYMQQPKGFDTNPDLVCKLHKSLYGLKQSPRCWNIRFTNFLKNFNFIQLEADKCVFRSEINNDIVFLALYVDDGLIMSKNTNVTNKILEELNLQFKIKVMKNLEYFVGLEIQIDEADNKTYIHQRNYIIRMLQKFQMENCKPVATPIELNVRLNNSDCPSTKSEIEEMNGVPYRELVGSLMFAAIVSRPDILFAVTQVSRFLNNPGVKHWKAAKRILRYLQGTREQGIVYSHSSNVLKVYCDADFANDESTRKSISGYISVLAGGPVTWSSRQQRCVARSTTEAEYISASEAAQEIAWLHQLLEGLLEKPIEAIPLFIDNQSAMNLAKNSEHHKLTKHIDIKYHYIRECVENHAVELRYVASKEQLADFLTKALSKEKFLNNIISLNISKVSANKKWKSPNV